MPKDSPYNEDFRLRYGHDEVVQHHWGQYLVIIVLILVVAAVALILFGGPISQFVQNPPQPGLPIPTP